MAAVHPPRTVLLVEDQADVRESMADLLEVSGYPVCTAANGREALDLLRSSNADVCLILLDLMMPVMNGWDFAAAVARDPALCSIPIAVLSGGLMRGRPEPPPQAVVSILKPVHVDELLETLALYCTR